MLRVIDVKPEIKGLEIKTLIWNTQDGYPMACPPGFVFLVIKAQPNER